MELEPHFFALVQMEATRNTLGKIELAVGNSKKRRKQLLGFSRVGQYTLIKWRVGDEQEFAQGETFFSGIKVGKTRVLTAGGGDASTYNNKVEDQSRPLLPGAIANQLDPNLGKHGVPPAIASALRLAKNYRTFQI